jgi:hypothetical protein
MIFNQQPSAVPSHGEASIATPPVLVDIFSLTASPQAENTAQGTDAFWTIYPFSIKKAKLKR